MNLDLYLMYGTFLFLGILVICWIGNFIIVQKKGSPSKWMSRGLYSCGLLAILCNGIRMFVARDTYKGTLVFANIIAFICILIAFVRSEQDGDAPL